MTTQEFSREFDILYNNLASNTAPPLNEYEKSVFLTKAQSDIVLELYSGRNNLGLAFESSEEVRRYLRPLIKYNSIDFSNPSTEVQDTSTTLVKKWFDATNKMLVLSFYRPATSDPLFYDRVIYPGIGTIREELVYTYTADTGEVLTRTIPIIPVTHDDLQKVLQNPFKRPKKTSRALRLDGHEKEFIDIPEENTDNDNKVTSNNGTSICIYVDNTDGKNYDVTNGYVYKEWYLRYPSPIMLADEGLPSNAALTIQGYDYDGTSRESELPESLHRMILDRAVLYAKQAYIGGQTQA